MEERWIEIPSRELNPRGSYKPKEVVAISDLGNWKRRDGRIEPIPMRSGRVRIYGRRIRAYIVIAMNFLVTVRRPDQILIDHITHHPEGINPNDVRNLRWCSSKENQNFEEALENMSKAKLGAKNPMYHKKLSDEARKKLSKSKTEWWSKRRTPVIWTEQLIAEIEPEDDECDTDHHFHPLGI